MTLDLDEAILLKNARSSVITPPKIERKTATFGATAKKHEKLISDIYQFSSVTNRLVNLVNWTIPHPRSCYNEPGLPLMSQFLRVGNRSPQTSKRTKFVLNVKMNKREALSFSRRV